MFSGELIELLKATLGKEKDSDLVDVIPAMNKGNLSSVKSGKRHLTEEQAVFIAEKCNLNIEWVLVNLAEERAKNDKIKWAWASLAKKISKTVTAAILVLSFVFCGVQNKENSKAVFV